MLYYPSMHKNLENKKRKKHSSILNRFFYFFKFSFFGQVTLSRSSFIQTSIFRKISSFFSTWHFFYQQLFILNIPFFSFRSTLKSIFSIFQFFQFFKKMNTTLIFYFSSFIQNKTLSYYEKETK